MKREPKRDLAHGDERNVLTPRTLALRLLDTLRTVGLQRGMDVALSALFVRWWTLRGKASGTWESLCTLAPGETQRLAVEQMIATSIPLASDHRTGVAGVEWDALPAVLDQVSSAIKVDDPGQASVFIRDTFEALLELSRKYSRETGEFDTPTEVADLLVRLTGEVSGTVLDPACGRSTTLLQAVRRANGPIRVIGIDVNADMVRLSRMRLRMAEVPVDIGLGDAFSEAPRQVADAVVLQPPWGVKVPDEHVARLMTTLGYGPQSLHPSFRRGDLPWLLLAQDALSSEGRAAVVLTASSVGTMHREVHGRLLASGSIEAIISLPPGGLFSHTAIGTVIWLVRHPQATTGDATGVLLADAEHLLEGTVRGEFSVQGADAILDLVTQFRATGTVNAPPHIARVVDTHELQSTRGLAPQAYLTEPPPEAVTHPRPERRLLTRLNVENFKAFGTTAEVDLAPLTLVYGANSAGKSSLIQSLLLLQQSLDSDRLITQGPVADVGGFTGIVHRHEPRPLRLGFQYGVLPGWVPSSGTPDPALLRDVRWEFRAGLSKQGALTGVDIGFGAHRLQFVAGDDADQLDLILDSLDETVAEMAAGLMLYPFDAVAPRRADVDEERHSKNRRHQARSVLRRLRTGDNRTLAVRRQGLLPTAEPHLPWALKSASTGIAQGHLTTTANRIARLGAGVGQEVRSLLGSLVYLGPLRSAPQRFYDRSATPTSPGSGHHVAMFLFDNSSVTEQVNTWLSRLEVPYSLDVLPVQASGAGHLVGDLVAVSLTDRRSKVTVTPADVGFGISQVLPVIVESLSRRESILCIEQPETHLHPRLQARLADLFVEATKEEGRANQVIVETHSEHLILRVQRRIREGSLEASQVAVLYVDQGDDGRTVVTRLRLDRDGNFLDDWPHGFFDERLDELFGEA